MEGDPFFFADSLKGQTGAFNHLVDIEITYIQHRTMGTIFIQFQKSLGKLAETFGFKYDDV